MSVDILIVPISTVASESTFNVGVELLTNFVLSWIKKLSRHSFAVGIGFTTNIIWRENQRLIFIFVHISFLYLLTSYLFLKVNDTHEEIILKFWSIFVGCLLVLLSPKSLKILRILLVVDFVLLLFDSLLIYCLKSFISGLVLRFATYMSKT